MEMINASNIKQENDEIEQENYETRQENDGKIYDVRILFSIKYVMTFFVN